MLLILLPGWTSGRVTPPSPAEIDRAILPRLQWRKIGPAHPSGRTVDLTVIESAPGTVYAATATGAIVTYYVNPKSEGPEGKDAPEVQIVVLDPSGKAVRSLHSPPGTGVQRVVPSSVRSSSRRSG